MTARSIWSYQENFDFRRDIGPGDPFHHPLESHRGEYNRLKMLAAFHLDRQGRLRPDTQPTLFETVLFGGHVGCGKSTELRDYAGPLSHTYQVRRLELTKLLDINNLRFSDLVIALAHELTRTFADEQLNLRPDPVFLNPVIDWFETRIIKQERFKDLEGDIRTEAKAQAGIPFLASLLATLTTKVRGGVSYREELRREIRDHSRPLLDAFNALIAHANDLLKHQGRGPLLFIIDGTDKLSKEDADTLFHTDVTRLADIQTNLIVCAPISVLLETGATAQRFTRVQLPMVKIFEADETERPQEVQALCELVLKRMPLAYFDDIDTLRYLVRMSGGHVRDLLRLVRAAFACLDEETCITRTIAERAVRSVAADYQRLVRQSDWADLVRVDRSQGEEKDRTDDRLRLLYDLVLLEYNSFWWRSHPLVRTLPPYARAHHAAGSGA